jgi:hypothetical protein
MQLGTLVTRVYSLQARDAMDLTAAMRNIAVGFVGEEVGEKGRVVADTRLCWGRRMGEREWMKLQRGTNGRGIVGSRKGGC